MAVGNEALEALGAALYALKDQPERMIDVLCSYIGSCSISEVRPYESLINRLARSYFGGSLSKLCHLLQARLERQPLPNGSGREFLSLAVINQLGEFMIAGKANDDAGITDITHYTVYFAGAVMLNHPAAVTRLLRTLGARCHRDLYEELRAEIQGAYQERMRVAFAEGQIKREGPCQVLAGYRSWQQSPVGAEALKTELRELCLVNTPSEATLDQAKRVYAWLAQLIGNFEARLWFTNNFPHLVGQID